ncbi:MAG: anti-sigma factor family protein [Lachnospiraceae bacterium]
MDCSTAEKLVTAYINRTLSPRQLEEFIKHVESCPSCYEELEIYFTTDYAIRQLDNKNMDAWLDIKKILKQDLHNKKRFVHRRKIRHSLLIAVGVFMLMLILGALGVFIV